MDERVACIHGLQEAALGVTEIGHRVQRDVRNRLAEHDMENKHVVDGASGIADGLGEGVGGLNRKTGPVERRVERHVAGRYRARRRMPDNLPKPEILEKVSLPRLAHAGPLCRAVQIGGGISSSGYGGVKEGDFARAAQRGVMTGVRMIDGGPDDILALEGRGVTFAAELGSHAMASPTVATASGSVTVSSALPIRSRTQAKYLTVHFHDCFHARQKYSAPVYRARPAAAQ